MNLFRYLRSLLPLELSAPQNLGKKLLTSTGYFRLRTRLAAKGAEVADLDLYRPLYAPWEGQVEFRRYYDRIRPYTLVSAERCWILLRFLQHALQLPGHFAEFGVFRGGTALLAAEVLRDGNDRRPLHLFDSFAGMPDTSPGEAFEKGDFARTSEAAVRALVSPSGANIILHPGYIPDTFANADIAQLAFAHVDVDLYQTVIDCVEFIYPRLVPGGILVFDDYGFPSCSRARQATDRSFAARREKPIYLPTGQAFVLKLA